MGPDDLKNEVVFKLKDYFGMISSWLASCAGVYSIAWFFGIELKLYDFDAIALGFFMAYYLPRFTFVRMWLFGGLFVIVLALSYFLKYKILFVLGAGGAFGVLTSAISDKFLR